MVEMKKYIPEGYNEGDEQLALVTILNFGQAFTESNICQLQMLLIPSELVVYEFTGITIDRGKPIMEQVDAIIDSIPISKKELLLTEPLLINPPFLSSLAICLRDRIGFWAYVPDLIVMVDTTITEIISTNDEWWLK